MPKIGQQTVRNIESRLGQAGFDQSAAKLQSWLWQVVAVDEKGAFLARHCRQAPTQSLEAQSGIAQRAADENEIPCFGCLAPQSAPSRHLAYGGEGKGQRSRRADRVATQETDAKLCLICGKAVTKVCDPGFIDRFIEGAGHQIADRQRAFRS